MCDEITLPFWNCNRWNLGVDNYFHATFSWACGYVSMLGIELIHASKGFPYEKNWYWLDNGLAPMRQNTITRTIWWRHHIETFSRYWPLVREIHRSPVDFPHKGQWRGALIFSLIWAWTNCWSNDRNAGDLRRHRTNYDVTVMYLTVSVIA